MYGGMPYLYLRANTKMEQIEVIKRETSLDLRPYIKTAFEAVRGNKTFTSKEDNNEGIEIIYRIAKLLSERGSFEQKDHFNKIPPDFFEGSILSNRILKLISPEIKKLRNELFSTEDPPFSNSPKKALDWIKREAKRDIQKVRSLTEDERKKRLLRNRFIYYPGKDGWKEYIQLWENTLLAKLEEETRRILDRTYFNQWSLIGYVLAGIRPNYPLYRFSTHSSVFKGEPSGKKITIELYRPISKEFFLKLHTKVREAFGIKEKSILNEKHNRIHEFIERHGGPPEGKKKEFWFKVCKEWNKKYPDDKYSDSDNLRKAYQRIEKRFQF